METQDQLIDIIHKVADDERLKPIHISLFFALCHVWIANSFHRCYNVSRKQLMRISRIQSKTTYHKTMSELIDMGYISYLPSYHPKNGSKVSLLVNNL